MFTILEDQEHTACLPGLVWIFRWIQKPSRNLQRLDPSGSTRPLLTLEDGLLGLVSVVRITPHLKAMNRHLEIEQPDP